MSKYTGIIFDMDGTLVDSEVIWERAEQEMFADRKLVYSDEVRQQVIGLRLDAFFTKLIQIFNLPDKVEPLMHELEERFLVYVNEVQPKSGALELIEYTASLGIPYAIASSSPMSIIQGVVNAQGWSTLIPHLYTANDVPLGKPAPDVYLYACEQLNLTPSTCLALEDSPNGARAAVSAGMTCYAIPDFHSTPAKFNGITPHIFNNLHDVLASLKETH
jgi:beta-phosphoglucomutase-like phosphatase (HAD superfamily)